MARPLRLPVTAGFTYSIQYFGLEIILQADWTLILSAGSLCFFGVEGGHSSACAGFLLGLIFHPQDGGNMFFRNVGLSPNWPALQFKTPQSPCCGLGTR
jgi:hypothetical protein